MLTYLILLLLMPILFIAFGWMWMHGHYPKRRNAFCGYRTALSMRNDDIWKFSQELFGRVSWWCGWVLLAVSLLAALALCHWGFCIRDAVAYFVIAQVGLVVPPVLVIVEAALRRRFVADVKAQGEVFNKDRHQRKFGTYVTLFLSVLLLPVIFIVIGWMGMNGMFPESINATYGYRTALSMQSLEAWCFAQSYFGLIAWRVGWISLALSVCFNVLLGFQKRLYLMVVLLVFVQLVGMATLTILPVENALAARFGTLPYSQHK